MSSVDSLIVWPQKNAKDELMNGTHAASIAAYHPLGWIQTDIFILWFDHFVKHTKPSEDDFVCLEYFLCSMTTTRILEM